MPRLSLFVLLLIMTSGSTLAHAQASPAPPTKHDVLVASNLGLRFGIAPGIVVPSDGDVGFSLMGDVRYGFETGPLLLAPGLRLAGYFQSAYNVLSALGTLQVMLPLGPVGPFVVGGVGPGYISDPSETGLAHLAGGGVLFQVSTRFAFGAEVTYQGITGTGFGAWLVGPIVTLDL